MIISRRKFLKYCTVAAGALGITTADLPKLESITSNWYVRTALASDGDGKATIEPSESKVGESHDYAITFTVGHGGIVKGGYIMIDLPSCAAFHGLRPALNWSRPQLNDAAGEGFVDTDQADKVSLHIESLTHPLTGLVSFRIKLVATTQLNQKETLTVRYTNARAQWIAQECRFRIYVDADGDGQSEQIAQPPKVFVRGGAAMYAKVVIPSIAGQREKFDVKVAILDQLGFPARDYRGRITLSTNGATRNLPMSYRFKSRDNSVHVFRRVSFKEDGVFTITVDDGSIHGVSNPCLVRSEESLFNVYWGDIHWHSNHSDGLRSAEEGYYHAKNVSFLDFTGMTDHDSFLDSRGLWPQVALLADRFYRRGKFVTFDSYEWTSPSALKGGYGHRNVYYPDNDQPLFASGNPETATPDGLWSRLAGSNAITIPHHPAHKDTAVMDWSYFNEEMETLVEIYSGYGNSEHPEAAPPYTGEGAIGHYVQDALAMGYRLGFVASTDSHYTLPGGNEYFCKYFGDRYALPALTAVYSPSLEKNDIMKHLKMRHTYATTGKRIILVFRMNDSAMMGSELASTEPPRMSVRVIGGNSVIRSIEIVRDNETIYQAQPDSNAAYVTYEDSQFGEFPGGSVHYYYVRVTLADTFFASTPEGKQEFSHMAWSSPIWVIKN
ncbi:MAG: DUF3604 domain-containing protein [Nitrospirota bacterium]